MPDQAAPQLFAEMKAGAPPQAEQPGYLEYLQARTERSEEDVRLARIVSDLAQVALHGDRRNAGRAEYADREPSLQARYWYRALGPLNPLTDAEPDMIRAAQMMYGREIRGSKKESATLKLDSAYILSEVARVTDSTDTRRNSLQLALGVVDEIKGSPNFGEQDAKYRLQTIILGHDLIHDVMRWRYSGNSQPVRPDSMPADRYREYEAAFRDEELRAIDEFGTLVQGGISDENFGVLFEWYLILAERHKSWAEETIDNVAVRGATSRENAEWTGEDEADPSRVTGNHDVVIAKRHGNEELETARLQLKTVKESRIYDPQVTVLNFQEVLQHNFRNIDEATAELQKELVKMRQNYRGEA